MKAPICRSVYVRIAFRVAVVVSVVLELLLVNDVPWSTAVALAVAASAVIAGISYHRFFRPVSSFFRLVEKFPHEYHLEKRPLSSVRLFASRSSIAALIVLGEDLLNSALPNALQLIPPGDLVAVTTHLVTPKIVSKRIKANEISCLAKPGFSRAEAGICAYAAAGLRLLKSRTWAKPNLGSRKWWKIKWVKQ